MDRSLAGRTGIGRLFDPSPRRARRPGRSRAGRAGLARDWARRAYAHLRRWWWPFSRAADLIHEGCAHVWHRRRLRIGLLAGLVSLMALAGGWLWLRHSSLVAVEHVQVSGVHGPEAKAIDAALTRAARQMSTLDVRTGALDAAVVPYRVVRAVRASASFPHGLHLRVVEQLPVAALTVGGERTAVAADGVVLGPALLTGSLPALGGGLNSAATGLPEGQRVHGAPLLASLTLLGAAPAPLARAVLRMFAGPKGITAAMRGGLIVYFGDATRPHAKWISLARVLTDPSSQGASYVDVRLPERPAAGFSATSVPETGSSTTEPTSSSDPTSAAELAAGLTAAAGISSSSEPSSAAGESSSGAPAEAASSAPAQTGSTATGETTPEASPTAPAPGG